MATDNAKPDFTSFTPRTEHDTFPAAFETMCSKSAWIEIDSTEAGVRLDGWKDKPSPPRAR